MKFDQEQIAFMQDGFESLSEQEKEILRRLVSSDAGLIIGKVMGPDFMAFMQTLRAPRRGLAAPR